MADAIVSVVLEQLRSSTIGEIRIWVRLIVTARKAVEKLTTDLQIIRDELKDAEEKLVKEEAVSAWLEELKEASYDMDDMLDAWNTNSLKLQTDRGVANASLTLKEKVRHFFLSPGYCFRGAVLRCEIASKIKEMNERLDLLAREKDKHRLKVINIAESVHNAPLDRARVTTSFVDVSDIYGLDEEKRILLSKLLYASKEDQNRLHIISIVGMGRMGKTTLAQFVFNDHEIIQNFEKRIWVCVSHPFDECRVARAILEALTGSVPGLHEFKTLLVNIANYIEGKKLLLVLDDVWTEDDGKWNALHNCLEKCNILESKILVTTRKETVARMMGSIDLVRINGMSEDKCCSFFDSLAFVDRSDEECERLKEVVREIVEKCKGLPLPIKTIRSLLRFKNSEMWDIEEFKKDLFPSLLLSYNDLPFMIRRCFLYCAIFPKDYNMEKDQLIQLWMAQGYLGNGEVEVTGEEYFDYLAARSFFKDFQKDDDGKIIKCKVHDMLHDFVQSLTKNECSALQVNDSKEPTGEGIFWFAKVRHAMVTLSDRESSFPISMINAEKLRSLFLIYERDLERSVPRKVQDKLWDELKCLRALGVVEKFGGSGGIERISGKIGKLIHLRYLNLSCCRELIELPETLCELFNLQTLDVSGCGNLEKLPQGIGKLINLRHLLNGGNDSLKYMPKGIERLTCLRTLKEFVVSRGGSKGSTVECLKNLKSLGGSLFIKYLGNVTNLEQAKRAQLENKKYLTALALGFDEDDGSEGDQRNIGLDEGVLESLQPPPNLEILRIEHYRGKILFPNWMMLLTKLRKLEIRSCMNCDYLPPLGKLSSLEELFIYEMKNVKRVGNEFLGIEDNNNFGNGKQYNIGTTSSSSSITAFPKLQSLSLLCMDEWEEWDYKRAEEEDFTAVKIMPNLRFLEIKECKKLKELPDHLFQITVLEKFDISDSAVLEQRCRKENGDYWHKIAYIPTIRAAGREIQHTPLADRGMLGDQF